MTLRIRIDNGSETIEREITLTAAEARVVEGKPGNWGHTHNGLTVTLHWN